MDKKEQTCYTKTGPKISMAREAKTRSKPDLKKAKELHQKLLQRGLGDRFKGMSDEQIIQALKKTREEIWQEKLAARS